ncbi:protein of unknown function [Pseudodesulfovibrio profundus]|uniref:Uncharacterized protein n=1 Tax=Pseudodesulfovibrio profundus TaxID=57320 RepID=A0A2C8FCX9_9BACT|nr:hypothetical protein [Pseudodesulfovibrio profundus]SOB60634.1 protein of unknown function [Pseudodesulfovibrio profundus]
MGQFKETKSSGVSSGTPVTFGLNPELTNHQIQVTVTGSPTAGTLAVTDENDQSLGVAISMTAPTPQSVVGSFGSMTFTPSLFDGISYSVTVRSWD